VVDFDEVYVNAVSQVSIDLLRVKMKGAVIDLVNVFRFLSENAKESNNF